MNFDEWWEDFVAEHDEWKYADSAALRRAAFEAGAASRDAEVAELVSALRLWKLASNNSEESELDDMACYCVPMPLFCDADEATEAVLDKVRKP